MMNFTIFRKSATVLVMALGGAFGGVTPAFASTSSIEAASIPFALGYGACIYSNASEGAEVNCQSERQAILAEADLVLSRFHPGEKVFAYRSLQALFDDMDEQASDLRRENKPVGPEVITFMKCTSAAMRGSNDFQRGVAVDGSGAFQQCRDIYDSYLALERGSSTVQRNVNYMRYVKSILPSGRTGIYSNQQINHDGLLIERGPRD
ncbi:hypothetical protein K3175_13180 [Qipengyuania sp. GH1]|uniref:hypothetical protein n=1 Tax=Qipengyuania aestuarii TaxID=2867241 RepID=UPI001C886083|nr:hypothetical protein [Qipengyuania aestuarii]MBX7536614.1 hypothetical protein [Qipengyuania aestuarii]